MIKCTRLCDVCGILIGDNEIYYRISMQSNNTFTMFKVKGITRTHLEVCSKECLIKGTWGDKDDIKSTKEG